MKAATYLLYLFVHELCGTFYIDPFSTISSILTSLNSSICTSVFSDISFRLYLALIESRQYEVRVFWWIFCKVCWIHLLVTAYFFAPIDHKTCLNFVLQNFHRHFALLWLASLVPFKVWLFYNFFICGTDVSLNLCELSMYKNTSQQHVCHWINKCP